MSSNLTKGLACWTRRHADVGLPTI